MPDDLIVDTLLELEQRFGAASCETAPIRGQWTHQGQQFRDDLMRVFVDVEDHPEHRQFFIDLKDRLKKSFQQLDIWITTHPLEILRHQTPFAFSAASELPTFQQEAEQWTWAIAATRFYCR